MKPATLGALRPRATIVYSLVKDQNVNFPMLIFHHAVITMAEK